jgi:hypothetical protein
MSWIDTAIVAVCLFTVFSFGFVCRKYMKTISDFLTGGRVAGRYVLAVASGEAALGIGYIITNRFYELWRLGDEPLPGMVFTNEPGVYLKEEGIGVRIEEDLLITETGNELLSKNIPSAAADVEHYLK